MFHYTKYAPPSYSHELPTLFIQFVFIWMYCTAHSQHSVGNDVVMRFSQWDWNMWRTALPSYKAVLLFHWYILPLSTCLALRLYSFPCYSCQETFVFFLSFCWRFIPLIIHYSPWTSQDLLQDATDWFFFFFSQVERGEHSVLFEFKDYVTCLLWTGDMMALWQGFMSSS